MIHFEHKEYLWLLVLVLLMGGLWIYGEWKRRRRLEAWADSGMFGRLIPDRSGWRPVAKMILTLMGLALLVVALVQLLYLHFFLLFQQF